jgi:hypothetical protein
MPIREGAKMKPISKFQRISAAIAAVALSFSIVWLLSDYAYPQFSSGGLGEIAQKALFQPHS